MRIGRLNGLSQLNLPAECQFQGFELIFKTLHARGPVGKVDPATPTRGAADVFGHAHRAQDDLSLP
ncbi:hypothetical protein [Pedococcus soli]